MAKTSKTVESFLQNLEKNGADFSFQFSQNVYKMIKCMLPNEETVT